MAEAAVFTGATAEELLDRYADMVFRAAYAMVKNRQDAEDIAQEVFLTLIQKAPAFESTEHQKAWLLRVTANRCKSFFRSVWQSRTEGIAEDFPAAELSTEESGVADAVNALPPKYRQVVYLYYVEGYAAKEIAQILDTPQNTVLSQLARARGLLKKTLGGDFDDAQE